MKTVRAHLIISGLVQGVYFRAGTVETARKYGTRGWVRNTGGGAVEAVIEGDAADVKKVIEWCKKGPPMARVEAVTVKWEGYKGEFADFTAVTRHSSD